MEQPNTLTFSHVQEIYVVYTNTDLTEGRGSQYPIYWCESAVTARRLAKGRDVMGSDARVSKRKMYYVKDIGWLADFSVYNIIQPSKEDIAEEQQQIALNKRIAATEKARSLGLTEEDIAALISEARNS